MNAQEIINYIATAPKKTPVKIYVNLREPVDFASCGAKVFGEGLSLVVFGNWADLEPVVTANAAAIADIVIENDRRNSGVPLLDIRNIRARIEPGAVIREKVEIGEGAVIMMGAVINIGAVIGEGTMIDMGAVLGGRAMDIVHTPEALQRYMKEAVSVSNESPVLLDRFLDDAVEMDVDAVADGQDILQVGKFSMSSRAYLGRFNFKGGDQQKLVGSLSGGERGRLHLAKTLLAGGNVLLLDEPSNDLDVETLRALEEALLEFAGCALVTSHDRWFLDRIATHILAFEGDSRVVFFDGNYNEYEADKRRRLGEEACQPKRLRFKPLKH